MLTAEQIPDEVVEAAAKAASEDRGYDWEMHPNFHKAFRRMATAAIRAALEAWPGSRHSKGYNTFFEGYFDHIILPLPQEPRDD